MTPMREWNSERGQEVSDDVACDLATLNRSGTHVWPYGSKQYDELC